MWIRIFGQFERAPNGLKVYMMGTSVVREANLYDDDDFYAAAS